MDEHVNITDRKTNRPEARLQGFAGVQQAGGYGAYTALPRRHQLIRLAFCWIHVRRKFYERAENSSLPAEVPRNITSLYAIDDEIRRLLADERRCMRDQRSRPIVDDPYRFLEARGRPVSTKSRLEQAIGYTLSRWDGLIRLLAGGPIDLDNNVIERRTSIAHRRPYAPRLRGLRTVLAYDRQTSVRGQVPPCGEKRDLVRKHWAGHAAAFRPNLMARVKQVITRAA